VNANRRRLNDVHELAQALNNVLHRKLGRILDRSLAHDLAVELRREIERTKDPRLHHLHELACVLESTLERNLMATSSFDPTVTMADLLARELDGVVHAPVPSRTRCRRLVGLAVTFLPVGHQARYEEEFRAELADLPAHKQVPHAIRLVTRSLVLRRALLDAPAMRSTCR